MVRSRVLVIAIFAAMFFAVFSKNSYSQTNNKEDKVVEVLMENDTSWNKFVIDSLLYTEGWDTLPNPNFWREIMTMSSDTSLTSIASNRTILEKITSEKYDTLPREERIAYKDSLKKIHKIPQNAKIYVTSGKKDFYQFHKVIPSIKKGIEVFIKKDVDPWFAQAILLIESPGKLQKSSAGAYGSFQLMRSVARNYGLIVNKYKDERKDFDKSATAAAKLIKTSCIPETKAILNKWGISHTENDLWFKFLVLHVYHAGAGNVNSVMNHIAPKKGGMELIVKLWQSESGNFKNSSQNYSQLAIAALIELGNIISEQSKEMKTAVKKNIR